MTNNFDPFDYENNAQSAFNTYQKAYSDATELMSVNARKACMEKLFEALSYFSKYVRYKSKVPRVKVELQIKECWPRSVRLISRTYLDFAAILLRFYYCFGLGGEFYKVENVGEKIEALIQGLEKINSFLPSDVKDEYLVFIKDFEKAKESQKKYKEIVEANTKNGCHDPSSIEILDKNDIYFNYIQAIWKEIAYKGICPLRSVDELYSSDSSGCVWGCLSLVGLFFLVLVIGSIAAQFEQKTSPQFATANITKKSSPSATFEDIDPFEEESYPKDSCGDLMPRNINEFPIDFYPVYIDFSESNLSFIKSNFCKDAYRITRKQTGQASIQVASFSSRQRAEKFRDFLINRVGNDVEIGELRRFDRPPS